jgi:NADP-dependent 3-hydroxy acid dehydrogenase YdfG
LNLHRFESCYSHPERTGFSSKKVLTFCKSHHHPEHRAETFDVLRKADECVGSPRISGQASRPFPAGSSSKYLPFGQPLANNQAMKFSLKNKWVLITGASSGFGAAAAVAFGAEGAKLLLGARRIDHLKKVAAEAKQSGAAAVHFHKLDVAQTASVETFFAWAKTKIANRQSPIANLHVLINNAGGAHGLDTVAEGKDADWETMLQTNVLGVLRVTRAALPLLPRDDGASILNIGSLAARAAYAGSSAYCAAKAGERQITRVLRLELFGTGIRVSTIDPGLAETEFSLVRFKGDARKAAELYEGANPLVAVDIAEILVWVASRPPHVNIDELLVKPVDQADMGKVFRRK